MQIHDLVQGTPEWDQFRLEHDGASEAAAMLGLSKKMSRNELLRLKHSGIAKEFSDWVQENILDPGHEFEALARPHAEIFIGDDLYPVTCSDGLPSASCDGLTMVGETAWEHKRWNRELAALARAGIVPEEHIPQCQQVLMVTGAKRLIFTVSDGTPENMLHVEVLPDPAWFERLRAGWAQFHKDLAAYVPVEVLPAVVAAPVTALPSVSVQVNGTLVVVDNFAKFETALLDFIEHRLIREPKTDQEFADLDLQIKALKGAEAALDAAETQMLAQISTVDGAKRTKDMLHKLTRDNRLMAEKLLEAKKLQVRTDEVQRGKTAFAEHVAALNARIGKPYMPAIAADFAGVIKGKRTVASLKDAIDTELARVKIEADATGSRILLNMATLRELAKDHAFLFSDTGTIVLKQTDDLTALVKTRIAEHQAAEQRKLDAERERIRAEEQAKAEKDAREKLAAEQAQREAEARALAATQQPAEVSPTPAPAPSPALTAAPVAPAPSVVPLRPIATSRAAPAATPPSLRLGVINERLSPIALTAEGLVALGFAHSATDKAAKLYHEHQFPHICAALVQHIEAVQSKQAA